MGYSGGGQGMLAGAAGMFTRIDKTCQQLEVARSFGISGARQAYCKVMLSTKWAKKAHVNMDDCMFEQPVPAQAAAAAPVVLAPVTPAVVVNPHQVQ